MRQLVCKFQKKKFIHNISGTQPRRKFASIENRENSYALERERFSHFHATINFSPFSTRQTFPAAVRIPVYL
jgi:hypothetical protein